MNTISKFRVTRFITPSFVPMFAVIDTEDKLIFQYNPEALQDSMAIHGKQKAFELFREEHMGSASDDKKELVGEAVDFIEQQ